LAGDCEKRGKPWAFLALACKKSNNKDRISRRGSKIAKKKEHKEESNYFLCPFDCQSVRTGPKNEKPRVASGPIGVFVFPKEFRERARQGSNLRPIA
jgi:hypothetical protein